MCQGQGRDLGWLRGMILGRCGAQQSFLCKQGEWIPTCWCLIVCSCWFCSLTRKGVDVLFTKHKRLRNVSCWHLGLGQSAARLPLSTHMHGLILGWWHANGAQLDSHCLDPGRGQNLMPGNWKPAGALSVTVSRGTRRGQLAKRRQRAYRIL